MQHLNTFFTAIGVVVNALSVLVSEEVAVFFLKSVVLVVKGIRGGTETVKAECLAHLVSLSLNSG